MQFLEGELKLIGENLLSSKWLRRKKQERACGERGRSEMGLAHPSRTELQALHITRAQLGVGTQRMWVKPLQAF